MAQAVAGALGGRSAPCLGAWRRRVRGGVKAGRSGGRQRRGAAAASLLWRAAGPVGLGPGLGEAPPPGGGEAGRTGAPGGPRGQPARAGRRRRGAGLFLRGRPGRTRTRGLAPQRQTSPRAPRATPRWSWPAPPQVGSGARRAAPRAGPRDGRRPAPAGARRLAPGPRCATGSRARRSHRHARPPPWGAGPPHPPREHEDAEPGQALSTSRPPSSTRPTSCITKPKLRESPRRCNQGRSPSNPCSVPLTGKSTLVCFPKGRWSKLGRKASTDDCMLFISANWLTKELAPEEEGL